METVQPIRDKNKIEEIKAILKRNNTRDYLLFVLGINTGLRISDILKLRVSDVKNRTHIDVREEKTNKDKRFLITSCLQKALNEYLTGMNDDEFLFKSQKGANKAIERWQAHKIINNAARQAGINDKIGTHTLRKTFGYFHYQQFKDVAVLQETFNHSAPSVTLRYIGINADIQDNMMKEFGL